jgi:hypothetical protein
MRQRAAGQQGDSADRLSDAEVLDTHEQEAVVAELRGTLLGQSRLWRRVFGALGLLLAAAFACFAFAQLRRPWVSFRHHSQLKEALPAGGVAAGEAGSAAVMAAAAAALLAWAPQSSSSASAGRRSRAAAPRLPGVTELRVLYGALASAVAMAVFWGRAIAAGGRLGLLSRLQQLQLAWLPLAPLAYAALALTVVRQYGDTAQRLKALEGQMYNYEGA